MTQIKKHIYILTISIIRGSDQNLSTSYIMTKESGRMRRRFGRNACILKRLKNYR